MLNLSRKLNETVVIGKDIKVTVRGIGDGRVELSFDAPKPISIHREEVFKRICKRKQSNDQFYALKTL